MRPSWENYFMEVARKAAEMSTCARRSVGCVLVDHRNFSLSSGMNGVPPGWPHCRGEVVDGMLHDVVPCPGVSEPPGLTDNPTGKLCHANHAEANALLNCPDIWRIYTAYCTVSPCVNCVKLLLCTGTIRIVYLEEYAPGASKDLWLAHGGVVRDRARAGTTWIKREWIKL